MKGGGSGSITISTARKERQLVGHTYINEQFSSSIKGGI
jgi:hypothetical protein